MLKYRKYADGRFHIWKAPDNTETQHTFEKTNWWWKKNIWFGIFTRKLPDTEQRQNTGLPSPENHFTHQQSPWRQILEVARQKERATRRHVPEAQDTFLPRNERARQGSRQSTQTADIEESTVVSDRIYLNTQMMTYDEILAVCQLTPVAKWTLSPGDTLTDIPEIFLMHYQIVRYFGQCKYMSYRWYKRYPQHKAQVKFSLIQASKA